MSPSVLVVDDDPVTLKLLAKSLRLLGCDVTAAGSGAEALEHVGHGPLDLVLLDIRMPGMDGLEVLREIKRRDSAIDVVMTTSHPELRTAIEALKEGASDYLEKPLNQDVLKHRVAALTERRFLRSQVSSLRSRLGERLAVRELIGASPEIVRIKAMMAKVAMTDSSVLIQGESGTGKEVVASAIHRLSRRGERAFIPVNCGAIPGELMESEFFGHVRGAFTGAVADTLGLFRSAEGGTVFLDEIGELPPALQSRLLRVLQEREVRPVGSSKSHPVDVRVIAATNRDLEQAVREGAFRQDLYYRLNVVRLVVPPLRDRKADLPLLVTHFIRALNDRFGRDVREATPEALALLNTYDFPGNVRELENVLERAYALGVTASITPADLPTLGPAAASAAILPEDRLPTLAEMERELIRRAIRLHPQSRDEAARALGLSPRTMYRRLKEYGLR
jgi:DNA-binding NtrC family response regulator